MERKKSLLLLRSLQNLVSFTQNLYLFIKDNVMWWKTWTLKLVKPGFEYELCHLIVLWSWRNYLCFLSFWFFFCSMRIIIVTLQMDTVEINETIWGAQTLVPHMSRDYSENKIDSISSLFQDICLQKGMVGPIPTPPPHTHPNLLTEQLNASSMVAYSLVLRMSNVSLYMAQLSPECR